MNSLQLVTAIFFKRLEIFLHYLFTGVLKETFVKDILKPSFYEEMTQKMTEEWQKRTGKTITDTMKEYLIENIGAPVNDLLR